MLRPSVLWAVLAWNSVWAGIDAAHGAWLWAALSFAIACCCGLLINQTREETHG